MKEAAKGVVPSNTKKNNVWLERTFDACLGVFCSNMLLPSYYSGVALASYPGSPPPLPFACALKKRGGGEPGDEARQTDYCNLLQSSTAPPVRPLTALVFAAHLADTHACLRSRHLEDPYERVSVNS